ncbi:outer membrane protein assembly factor BamE [Marinomonas sp. 15G1-11]|uniref:Outer membrane protein assembly factor BamE n=1 Tax=Marinomonas phaeophyticola TaxID=3004091 RepID=A0ABT4JUU7_9GAMM|nr:outer membrane protein assembly factor BamE [Marinomonas sp. 15G1-11]MCZ2722170.1 outer membrane protein assembly factor BamE [Marinomonas sp. 15G1-11]
MKKTLITFTLALSMSACSLFPDAYKTPVPQGNILKQEQVSQLELGMTEPQVRFLIGTPMIADQFTPNEWRYLFTSVYATDKTKKSEIDKLTLTFKNGILVKIDPQL